MQMSISPTSRDVVLAARRGLFIIDLHAPYEMPRFLPQGGTWDVADVQWNPHRSHAKYIVSTSSEKLLIWDLLLVGKTSIEHILHSHYRAITDINWHTSEPDLVVSTGIDSWLWCWDLRDLRNRHKPVFGMSAFNGAGTQVKWNRQDPHVLASSHGSEVLIWDRRKGSVPLTTIQAHDAKIYGIDWSHHERNTIVTCSLDKTIKVWDFDTACPVKGDCHPKITVNTKYPIWRARNLPFGHGVLSLPQRGETALELYADDNPGAPIHTFEGHTDVVKEFVWRRGEEEGAEFQLITWSKDRTLRFWPITPDIMQKAGYTGDGPKFTKPRGEEDISYRNPPIGSDPCPALSAPVGHRSILAEVRAPLPPRHHINRHDHSSGTYERHERENSARVTMPSSTVSSIPIHIRAAGGTMTRGNLGGRSARMDTLTWLSSVKVEKRRESFSDPRGAARSGDKSRNGSQDRTTSRAELLGGSRLGLEQGARENSQTRAEEISTSQSLQDEITTVLTKLAPHKIRLEKHDLTKRRTCTLGLHGPWGESSSVFIRVTFTFPRAYPQSPPPEGTPSVDLERNPLISIKSRAFILRRLRDIREKQRPCLEACLRFLLFGEGTENVGVPPSMDSESEDEGTKGVRRGRDLTVSLVRNSKNLAEPRTSQGVFGPNGELVCFFRAPPRIVRSAARDVSASPSVASHMNDSMPHLARQSGTVVDAMQRLAAAASDRVAPPVPGGSEKAENVLRMMTNLLTFSQPRSRHPQERSKTVDSGRGSFSLVSTRLSTVYIKDASHITEVDRGVAAEYIFCGASPVEMCKHNADVAQKHGRFDHQRSFKLLQMLLESKGGCDSDPKAPLRYLVASPLAERMLSDLYRQFSQDKDIQLLTSVAAISLQAYLLSRQCTTSAPAKVVKLSPALSTISKKPSGDYFTVRRLAESRSNTLSSGSGPRQPSSPATPPGLMYSASSSSKGSWSSLFANAGRSVFTALPDSPHESTPGGTQSSAATGAHSIPVPVVGNRLGQENLRRKVVRHGSPANHSSSNSKSWNDGPLSISRSTSSIPSVGRIRRPTFSQVLKPKFPPVKKNLVFKSESENRADTSLMFTPKILTQLLCHILVYSETLFRWGLLQKRAELISSIGQEHSIMRNIVEQKDLELDMRRVCPRCGMDDPHGSRGHCPHCDSRATSPCCSICRLPVKGLSFNCLKCCHLVHIPCRAKQRFTTCPAGCGCVCVAVNQDFEPNT
ncbi:hypothetical protein OE88DRAFT_1811180 [Heliocybe sulcata]|uniref:Uncharacterized protein n=1 Tax=Heliocybe sulcata TaxID=5364 RepID=A0A5C3MRB4_9AGAM|nr:hypothetical protein OE88DRAFT_1811180 [Heliocybe sulcata]